MNKYFVVVFTIILWLPFGGIAQTLSDSLLLYYPFNGDADDESGNAYDGTILATLTADRFGNVNSAYHFNGINEYIEFPLIADLKPDLPVSFSFWIKLEDLSPTKTVFVTTDFAQDNHSGVWMNMSSSGYLAINYGDASGNTTGANLRYFVGTTPLATGVWYHVAGVASGPADMQLYIDCVAETGTYSGSGGSVQYTAAPGNIGRKDVATVAPYYFQGTLDDFRYWNRALTQADIDALCNEALSLPQRLSPEQDDIVFFPNPLIGNLLHLDLDNPAIKSIKIIDISGRIVYAAGISESVDLTGVEPGLYIIELFDEGGVCVATEKLERL
jgi:hypothetical protein